MKDQAMMNRREALKTITLAGVGIATATSLNTALAQAATGPHTLPALPYDFAALEPVIDAQTMQIHHGKHHAAYVANLNKALADYPELAKKPVDELIKDMAAIPEKIRTAVRNNGGGHANHSLFWKLLTKPETSQAHGKITEAIVEKFGSFETAQEQFTKAAMSQFGSGWAWLSLDKNKQLVIEATANQDSPLMHGHYPLAGLDVWEHAYYLKYQNRRADYVEAFYALLNWDFLEERYLKAIG